MTTETTSTVACDQVAQLHADYQKCEQNRQAYQEKLAQAHAEEQAALVSDGPDDQVASKVVKAQALVKFSEAKIAHLEKAQERIIAELETAYKQGAREFTSALEIEIRERKSAIADKIRLAVDVYDKLTPYEDVSLPLLIDPLTQYAKAVREISCLRLSTHWGQSGGWPFYCQRSQRAPIQSETI